MAVYNPMNPQNSTLIQPITHIRCRFVMRDNERPNSSKNNLIQIHGWLPTFYAASIAFSAFPVLTNLSYGRFLAHSLYYHLPWFLFWYDFLFCNYIKEKYLLQIVLFKLWYANCSLFVSTYSNSFAVPFS